MSEIKITNSGYCDPASGHNGQEQGQLYDIIKKEVAAQFEKLLNDHKKETAISVEAMTNLSKVLEEAAKTANETAESNSQKVDEFVEEVKSKVNKTDIYDGLDCMDSDKVLSAKQGALLNFDFGEQIGIIKEVDIPFIQEDIKIIKKDIRAFGGHASNAEGKAYEAIEKANNSILLNPIESGIGDNSAQMKNINGAAISDKSISIGENCVAGIKAFYIAGSNNNSYTLDSVEGLEVGDVCSVLFIDILNGTSIVDRVYQDFDYIESINTSTNTIRFYRSVPQSSDPAKYVGFICVLKKPNIGTQITGISSFSSGYGCMSLGDRSRAHGSSCIAMGKNAISEGSHTKALNYNARAENAYTEALGVNSHAENNHTKAKAGNTHAEGDHTIAGSTNQHVQGKFNIEDKDGVYADIVGNGTCEDEFDSDGNIVTQNRSNAYTLDWDGNGWFAGDVTVTINEESISIASLLSRIVYLENIIANL